MVHIIWILIVVNITAVIFVAVNEFRLRVLRRALARQASAGLSYFKKLGGCCRLLTACRKLVS